MIKIFLEFGKNKGLTPAQLALTEDGRSYLEWGSENLNNPQWRAAFEDALRSYPKSKSFDEEAVRAQYRDYDPQDDLGRGIEAYVERARDDFELATRKELEDLFSRVYGI